MKPKIPVKMLTLTFFTALVAGFVLYKGGYFIPGEKRSVYISDPNGGSEIKSVKDTEFGLNTFQKLKLSGALDPENFDTVYQETPHYGNVQPDYTYLSSSKSTMVISPPRFDLPLGSFQSSFELQLDEQLRSKPFKKK
jgi:hypothetical protein